MKKRKTKWEKIEHIVNMKGIPTPPQARKLKIVKAFIKKNSNVSTTTACVVHKELHELTFAEFKSAFAMSALQILKYQSVTATESFLKGHYLKIIIEAIQVQQDGISMDGIEMLRFRPEYMEAVRHYCKKKKILLD